MAEEIDFENRITSNFQALMTDPDLDVVCDIPQCITFTHRLYIITHGLDSEVKWR